MCHQMSMTHDELREQRRCYELLVQNTPARFAVQVHESGLIWCPNAKVASSTIINALGLDRDMGGSGHAGIKQSEGKTWRKAQDLSWEEAKDACKQPHVTFTMVRDPYDRLASSYLDKVVLEQGSGCNEARTCATLAVQHTPTHRRLYRRGAAFHVLTHTTHTPPARGTGGSATPASPRPPLSSLSMCWST